MRESIEQNQTIGSSEISPYIFKAWGSLLKTCMCCHGPLYMIEYKAPLKPCCGHYTPVKPVLRDHCHERPPVFEAHIFLAGPTFQYN